MSDTNNQTEVFAVDKGEGAVAEFGGATIAGRQMGGEGRGELVTKGDGVMLVRLELAAGFDQDGHEHADHESIGYVMSGRVEMRVGEETRILQAGSTWYHPRGTFHTCKALEDAEILEFHAPLRQDVLELFGR